MRTLSTTVFDADLRLVTLKEKTPGTCCHMKCFEKCSYAEIEKHVFTMRELSRCQKDVYIIGKIKRKVPGWTQIKGSGKDTCTAMMTGMKFLSAA